MLAKRTWARVLLAPLILSTSACLGPLSRTPPPAPEPTRVVTLPALPGAAQTTAEPAGDEHPAHTAAAQGDVWLRIRAGLQMPRPVDERVATELRQLARRDRFVERSARRAGPWLHFIVEEIERRDMPMELALLPLVESGFRATAASPSGAGGLWQFMPATASNFGLERNWWYDGRRDVRAATHAALDYLQLLHTRFGDWLLAIAAYNAGEGTVGKAIARNRDRGLPTDFWSLELPRETTRYVPRLIAVAQILAHPQRYNVRFAAIANRPFFEVVDTGGQIELARARELAGIETALFNELNAAHLRWASAPEGPHELLVPRERAESLRQALARLPADERVRWGHHDVTRGETLSHIAARYDTSVEAIRRLNKLHNNLIRPGQALLIPVAGAAGAPDDSGPPAVARVSHRVRAGDSLWTIGRRYRVSVDELARWNAIAVDATLRPGQLLRVHSADTGRGLADDGDGAGDAAGRPYVVRAGDSLWAIARRHGLTVRALRQLNNLPGNAVLRPGQRLRLPAARADI